MKTNQFGKKGWTPDNIHNLNGKTYVITGTTSGTGFKQQKYCFLKVQRSSCLIVIRKKQKTL